MKQKLCLIVGILLIVLSVVSCTSGETPSASDGDRDVLYHTIGSEPFITLDPSAENSNGVYILQNVYETLTRYNADNNTIEPYLATEWSMNDDGTEWVFKIREDVKFHDGTSLNANSVKMSIERTINMGRGASYIWSAVESIEVVDEFTVKFNCVQPTPVDLIASAAYAAYIISEDACSKDSEWFNETTGNDGGSGPYMVKSLAPGDQVVLSAFEDYWLPWKENSYKNVIIKKSAESSVRRQLLESGEAQIGAGLSSTDLKAVSENPNLNVIYETTYDNIVIFLNSEKPPLDNVDFRRALSYSFPYQEVLDNVLEGRGAQSRGLVTPGLWGHSDDLMQYEFNLEKAKEYLDKSGVDPLKYTLEFAIQSGTTDYRDLAQLWQVYLKSLGINIEIRERNWDSHWEYAKNPNPNERQDMFIMIWWPDYASPISWFQGLVHSEDEVFFNLSYIKEEALDQMIEEAEKLTAVNRDKAEEIYIKIQEEVLDRAYMILPYDRVDVGIVSKNIEGYKRSPAYPTAVRYFDITKVK